MIGGRIVRRNTICSRIWRRSGLLRRNLLLWHLSGLAGSVIGCRVGWRYPFFRFANCSLRVGPPRETSAKNAAPLGTAFGFFYDLQKFKDFSFAHRLAEEVTLSKFTTGRAQERYVIVQFDTFGYDIVAQFLCQRHD